VGLLDSFYRYTDAVLEAKSMRSHKAYLPLFLVTTAAFGQKPPIRIAADLSDAPRKLMHAEIDIPVSAGPLTLTTPKWLPGHHGPGRSGCRHHRSSLHGQWQAASLEARRRGPI
jgi:hypothetical protein